MCSHFVSFASYDKDGNPVFTTPVSQRGMVIADDIIYTDLFRPERITNNGYAQYFPLYNESLLRYTVPNAGQSTI